MLDFQHAPVSNLELLDDALAGLTGQPKSLPCKYFYDATGAKLFEQICELPEYYPTRTELAIMAASLGEIARRIGPQARIVEFGSGEGIKIRRLLEALDRPAAYIPIDISAEQLALNATQLAAEYPYIEILPLAADYHADLQLPKPQADYHSTVVYFPGSTLGNFPPAEARAFLARMKRIAGENGAVLIGIDLQKDPAILKAAYNDSAGITAQFNLNLLARLNAEAGGDFNLDAFSHLAEWNSAEGAIEMFLISQREQQAHLNGQPLQFAAGERIHTEHSYKYTLSGFAKLTAEAGLTVSQVWTDPEELFSIQYLEPE